ncbi:MAG: hypothetical protein QOJ03_3324 [Frankiaceae bacterium]|jgi:hypothetical protein|nr:hypothetical protein [Frankiaceae bacterium]
MSPADQRDRNTTPAPGLASGALALLTREAGRAPLVAVSLALQMWERTSGMRSFAVRRGGEVLQIAAHTPLGRFLPQPVLDDGADEEASDIATEARDTTARDSTARMTPVAAAPPPPAAPVATPAPAPTPEAVEAGAPGAVTDKVERVTEQLHIEEPTSRDDLPIPDFDNVSLGSLRGRLRSLSLEQLVTLREWEQAHGHRLPVITLLDNRIAKVSAEQSVGDAAAYPADGGGSKGNSRVS